MKLNEVVSNVPWDALYVGMKVCSASGVQGVVRALAEIIDVTPLPNSGGSGNYVNIRWNDGSFVFKQHSALREVTTRSP